VNVPVQKPATKVETPVTPTNNNTGFFEHIVVTGETIYTIAKKYNLTTYQLKSSNNLTVDAVTVGQKLIIKAPRSVAAVNNDDEESPTGNTIKDPLLRSSPSNYGLVQLEEKGVAVWIADPDLDASKMLVLHRTAPVGTIIKVTNPMSNRSAFAKVVGKFTENETTKDVIIVMTKAVADAVGALDKRFSCNLTYGAQANEQQ
jgi:LysM repeat protein